MNRILIKWTSNRKKYSSSCWKDVLKQQWREASYRYRHKLENLANPHE